MVTLTDLGRAGMRACFLLVLQFEETLRVAEVCVVSVCE